MKRWDEDGPISATPAMFEWVDRFERYLRDLVNHFCPAAICEEYSETSVATTPGGAVSIAWMVAQHHGLEHVFCDPDRDERNKLYEDNETTEEADEANGFPLREGVWLARAKHLLSAKRVLFLCGANHVPTFKARLEGEGFAVNVYCADLASEWGLFSEPGK